MDLVSCLVFAAVHLERFRSLAANIVQWGKRETELAAPQAQHWDVYPQASLPQSALYDAVHYKPAYSSSEIFPFIQKTQK